MADTHTVPHARPPETDQRHRERAVLADAMVAAARNSVVGGNLAPVDTRPVKHALITLETHSLHCSHTERVVHRESLQRLARRERGATISVSERQRPAHDVLFRVFHPQ